MPLFLLLTMQFGCAPTCDQVCRKTLFDCELSTERVALATCIDSCDRQLSLYQDRWQDEELVDAFAEHRRCLMRETCDDIADGLCYDERIFILEEAEPTGPLFDPFLDEPTSPTN